MFTCGKRLPVKVKFNKPSLTQQQFKKDCDITRIVKHFVRYGVVPEGIELKEDRYVDCSSIPSFQDAKNMMIEAEKTFSQIPLDIRKLCDHDPAKVMDFINDPKNKEMLKEHGLLKPEEKEKEPSAEDKVVGAIQKGFESLKNNER